MDNDLLAHILHHDRLEDAANHALRQINHTDMDSEEDCIQVVDPSQGTLVETASQATSEAEPSQSTSVAKPSQATPDETVSQATSVAEPSQPISVAEPSQATFVTAACRTK